MSKYQHNLNEFTLLIHTSRIFRKASFRLTRQEKGSETSGIITTLELKAKIVFLAKAKITKGHLRALSLSLVCSLSLDFQPVICGVNPPVNSIEFSLVTITINHGHGVDAVALDHVTVDKQVCCCEEFST